MRLIASSNVSNRFKASVRGNFVELLQLTHPIASYQSLQYSLGMFSDKNSQKNEQTSIMSRGSRPAFAGKNHAETGRVFSKDLPGFCQGFASTASGVKTTKIWSCARKMYLNKSLTSALMWVRANLEPTGVADDSAPSPVRDCSSHVSYR